jgi:hypothetical protein
MRADPEGLPGIAAQHVHVIIGEAVSGRQGTNAPIGHRLRVHEPEAFAIGADP